MLNTKIPEETSRLSRCTHMQEAAYNEAITSLYNKVAPEIAIRKLRQAYKHANDVKTGRR